MHVYNSQLCICWHYRSFPQTSCDVLIIPQDIWNVTHNLRLPKLLATVLTCCSFYLVLQITKVMLYFWQWRPSCHELMMKAYMHNTVYICTTNWSKTAPLLDIKTRYPIGKQSMKGKERENLICRLDACRNTLSSLLFAFICCRLMTIIPTVQHLNFLVDSRLHSVCIKLRTLPQSCRPSMIYPTIGQIS